MNMIAQVPNRERTIRETKDAIWITRIQINALEKKNWLSNKELGWLAQLRREIKLYEATMESVAMLEILK